MRIYWYQCLATSCDLLRQFTPRLARNGRLPRCRLCKEPLATVAGLEREFAEEGRDIDKFTRRLSGER